MTYQQPQPYPAQIQRPPANTTATTGMVLGIVAIVIGVWAFVPILGLFAAIAALVPAIIAVVLGHQGASRAKTLGGAGRGQATTALVLGYVTIAILATTTLFWIVLTALSGASS